MKLDGKEIQYQNWGLIDYDEALNKQMQLVDSLINTKEERAKVVPHFRGYLIFCSHPPIVTLGRKTQPGDVFSWQGPTKEISRGGRATYHGPSQVVVYPILDLDFKSASGFSRDIGKFLRAIEESMVECLATYGITAQGKSLQKKNELDENSGEETGVWVGNKKIASLGIGVKKWVTYHGAALNFDQDSEAFQGMKPCGFEPSVMTCVREQLDKASPTGEDRRQIHRDLFQAQLLFQLLQRL